MIRSPLCWIALCLVAAASPLSAAEPQDVRSYTLASDAEYADLLQQFATMYPWYAPKPAAPTAGTKAPAPPAAKVVVPKMTAVPRTKTILVRGTKAELDTVDAVLKLLQGTGPTDAKAPQLVRLKVARVGEVTDTLAALELNARVLPLRNTNTLVLVPGDDAEMQQIKKVIDLVDKAEPKPEAKPAVATKAAGKGN